MNAFKLETTVEGASSCAAHVSANPTRQPCRTCRYFHSTKNAGPDGWCESIEDDVKSWWTGCVRHSPNGEHSNTPTPAL